MKSSFVYLACAIVCAVFCGQIANAEGVHYDVFVTASGTNLIIGGFDDAATVAVVPEGQMRVFGGEVIGSGTTAAFESSAPGEPGFRASPQSSLNNPSLMTPANTYSALAGSTPLTFNFQPITIGAVTRNLYFWDGTGDVAFSPVGSNVVLGLQKKGAGGWTSSINGSFASIVAGNTIQNTGATGSVHTHLYTSIANNGAAPDQGFYLYSLQLQMTGYASSDPLYFVYGALDPSALAPQFADLEAFEAAHGLAEGWVETNLVAVPEPSSVALAGLGVAGLAIRAWRRRQAAGKV